MPVTVIEALITATPAMLQAVLAIIAEIKSSGHGSAPITQAHVQQIAQAVNVTLPSGWTEDYPAG